MRRTIFGLLVVAVTCSGHAGELPGDTQSKIITRVDVSKEPGGIEIATFLFFRLVNEIDKKGGGAGEAFLRDTLRLDGDDARTYVQLAREAAANYRAEEIKAVASTCARRANLKTPQALANELESSERHLREYGIQSARRSQNALRPANARRIDDFVMKGAKQGNASRIKTDYLELMKLPGVEPQTMLADLCDARPQQ